MPLKAWVWLGLMLLAVGAGVVLLTSIAPRDEMTGQAEQNALPERGAEEGAAPVAQAADPAELPPPLAPATPRAALLPGPDGVVRMEIPFTVEPGPEPEPGFQADLLAYAAGRQAELPIRDGLATLEAIGVAGRLITFKYRVDIRLRLYTLPRSQVPLLDLLDGWLCDGSVCFQFHDAEFVTDRCLTDVLPLLQRGAVAVYEYRDLDGLPMATRAIAALDCAARVSAPPPGR